MVSAKRLYNKTMRSRRLRWVTLFAFALILVLVFVLATLIHEIGHGLTAEILGGKFLNFYIYPGIQVWPDFGHPYTGNWDNSLAYMYYDYGPGWQPDGWQNGFVLLMGSGTNLLLATIAIVLLWLFRPTGLLRLFLIAESIMFLDIVFYTFLPLLGLRHFFFIGGKIPEPLDGAMLIGSSRPVFLTAVFALLILYTLIIVRLAVAVQPSPWLQRKPLKAK